MHQCYENKLTFPIYIWNQKFENSMDLLPIVSENKPHYVYIKDFERFVFHKTKNTFARVVYGVLVVEVYWQNLKRFVWALMAHNLWYLKKEQMSLKIILNKYTVPFKLYADFESHEGFYSDCCLER